MVDRIALIGLGQMGLGMATNWLKEGVAVAGYDIRLANVEALIDSGGEGASSPEALVESSDVVATCLASDANLKVFFDDLIPNAREGQLFVDFSTMPPPETRMLAARLEEKGARMVDSPISGGRGGAWEARLSIFVGGLDSDVDRVWNLFEIAGAPGQILRCGEVGQGQVAKAVQQMKHRMPSAVMLEVMSFGVRAGLTMEQTLAALGTDIEGNDGYAALARSIEAGNEQHLQCLYTEWPYWIAEAKKQGFTMPMLEAMYEYARWGERVGFDVVSRPAPSIWNALMEDG